MTSDRPPVHRNPSSGSGYHGISSVQRKFTTLLQQRRSISEADAEEKTRLGLTLLYSPPEPLIDFIFVHGLGGGSVKTWRKHEEAFYFWPKNWIHLDSDLRNVRTFSFGYPSDWTDRKDSILNIHDFGRSLLGEMLTSPHLRQDGNRPVILIGHSMGGLVIKKAYILARQESRPFAARIKYMFFLATPHRGADSAQLLNNILNASLIWSGRPYVTDLGKDSISLQIINDDFRNYAHEVKLWSFYETLKTNFKVKSFLIVNRDSAILGYKDEEQDFINADHRGICKYESPDDPNYVKVRNALVTAVDDVLQGVRNQKESTKPQEMERLESYLNVNEAPESDLEDQKTLKTSGSCHWIQERRNFQTWRDYGESAGESETPTNSHRASLGTPRSGYSCSVYWLSAKPATGKSICAAHVVSHLKELGLDCSYFFFKFGVRTKQVLSPLFRSLAYQMAMVHPLIRESLCAMQIAKDRFDGDDEGAIWRKMFVNGIFKIPLTRPQYWVIDALDECLMNEKLFPFLQKLECAFGLRIFITSRATPELERLFARLKPAAVVDGISPEHTESDMKLYLNSDELVLPVDDPSDRDALVQRLLAKSGGCFLWVRLVLQQLEYVYSEDSIADVLEEIPEEMSEIYQRSLVAMSKNLREKKLTQTLLTWAVCSVRPLSLVELQAALRLDGGNQVRDVRKSIAGLCGQLLYVDTHDRVQMIHSTARDFLLDKELDSEFAVTREAGHERLAIACLNFMDKEMRPPRSRSLGNTMAMAKAERPVFANYASMAFSEHVSGSSAVSDMLLSTLARFLSTNVLAWIEYVAAETKTLYALTRAAKNFKKYLERRAKYVSPLGREVQIVDGWATDLIRLVAKFGGNLLSYPSSIFFLIPPFAPPESRLHQQVLNSPCWLEVTGQTGSAWDDCVSFIEYKDSWATALACGDNVFAIGMKSGRIVIYDQSTCQEKISLQHQAPGPEAGRDSGAGRATPVKLLTFDPRGGRLASSSPRNLCIWTIEGQLVHNFPLSEPCVTITFAKDDNALLAVNRGSRVTRWNLDGDEIGLKPPQSTTRRLSNGNITNSASSTPRQAPIAAAISPDQTMLALLYRGRPIYLWSLQDDTLLGLCGRDVGAKSSNISVQTALFNPNAESGLLAVAHQDGELALYDAWAQKELISVDGNAYTLASTPNGRTLATGDTRGTVQIWDFETLTLMYRINSGFDEVRSLAFSGDGFRLMDIRDAKTKIWEPSVLVRRTLEEDASVSDALTLVASTVGVNEESIDITVMVVHPTKEFVLAGRSDGSVVAYATDSGKMLSILYTHSGDIFITALASEDGLIASADAGGRILVYGFDKDHALEVLSRPLLKSQISEPIQQLVIDATEQHLLVSTADKVTIWKLFGEKSFETLVPSDLKSPADRRWTSSDGKLLGLTTAGILDVYSSPEPSNVDSIVLRRPDQAMSKTERFETKSFVAGNAGKHLIAALCCSEGNTSMTYLVVWANPISKSERAQITARDTSPVLVVPPKHIKHSLGTWGTSVVFLDHDLWVCSVDLEDVRTSSGSDIRRHFFIPHDLVGGANGVVATVTSRGYIIFAKESQLAVVKGGMEWSC